MESSRLQTIYVTIMLTKNETTCLVIFPNRSVDNVDNYFFNSVFPIESTFPAPIVINRSFFCNFFHILGDAVEVAKVDGMTTVGVDLVTDILR